MAKHAQAVSGDRRRRYRDVVEWTVAARPACSAGRARSRDHQRPDCRKLRRAPLRPRAQRMHDGARDRQSGRSTRRLAVSSSFQRRGSLARISHHLTAEARDRPAIASLHSIAWLNGLSSTPARGDARAPRTDATLTHFRSPCGEKYGLVSSPVPCANVGPSSRHAGDRSAARSFPDRANRTIYRAMEWRARRDSNSRPPA